VSERWKFASVLLVIGAFLAAILINSWRTHRSFANVLEKEGFAKSACGSNITVRDKVLAGVECWRGPLAPGLTGDIVTGHIPSFKKSDYLYFLGVVVAPSVKIDDAWFHRWNDQDTFRTSDGKYAVLWNLMDNQDSLERVLAAIRASLTP
jgi:hypothetical protein